MEFPLNVILLKTLKQLKEKLAVYAMNSYLYNSIFSSNELSNKNKGAGGRKEANIHTCYILPIHPRDDFMIDYR